jgi:hypothetical protein
MLSCHPSYGFRAATWEDWQWGQVNNSFVLTTTNVYMSIWSKHQIAPRSPSKVVIILYHYWIGNRRGRLMQWKYLMVKLWWSEVTIARQRWRTRAEDKYISPERCRRSAETEILKGVATMTTQVQHEWRSMPDMLQGGDPDIVHWNMWLHA